MLKKPTEYERKSLSVKVTVISRQVSLASLLVSAGYCQRAILDESGMIRNQMGNTAIDQNDRYAWDALCNSTA
jgi:hypothetical protein